MIESLLRKVLLAAGLTGLAVAPLLAAQTAAAPAPTTQAQTPSAAALPAASQIVAKYVEAIGGKAAWEKLTSRVSKGTFEMDQMGDATEEIDAKAPDSQYTLTESPQFVARRGCNGKICWEDLPQAGLRQLTGDQLAVMKRLSDFYFPIKLDEYYPKMTVKGKETVEGHSTYHIEAVPAEGGPEQLFFDADSGLLLRHDLVLDTPNGPAPLTTTLDDYRTVDGVKLPFVMRQSLGEFDWTVKLTDVKQNVPVDDSKFNMPPPEGGAAPSNE